MNAQYLASATPENFLNLLIRIASEPEGDIANLFGKENLQTLYSVLTNTCENITDLPAKFAKI